MPMAITVFKLDYKSFESLKMGSLYQDKLDATIEKLREDFYLLKKEIICLHHLDIKCINQLKYSVNGQIIEYNPNELRSLTGSIMKEYLCGESSVQ